MVAATSTRILEVAVALIVDLLAALLAMGESAIEAKQTISALCVVGRRSRSCLGGAAGVAEATAATGGSADPDSTGVCEKQTHSNQRILHGNSRSAQKFHDSGVGYLSVGSCSRPRNGTGKECPRAGGVELGPRNLGALLHPHLSISPARGKLHLHKIDLKIDRRASSRV